MNRMLGSCLVKKISSFNSRSERRNWNWNNSSTRSGITDK